VSMTERAVYLLLPGPAADSTAAAAAAASAAMAVGGSAGTAPVAAAISSALDRYTTGRLSEAVPFDAC